MSEQESSADPSDRVPNAQIVPNATGVRIVSKMWLLAVISLLLAIGMTWWSMDRPGTLITIRFQEGHGLAIGDAVRHRGIEVGRVQDVRLVDDLSGIDVDVALHQHAGRIAREGSRFWVVHPEVDINGVRGLETAIGAKYIRVMPSMDNPSNRKQLRFDGLSSAPPLGMGEGGLEVVLRGEERFGLSVGSPLTFRGIEIGQVLGSSLSPDARHVDTLVRIDKQHARLVTENSKFWKTSGVDIDISLTGVEFSAQSLATVMRGGVAMATPGPKPMQSERETPSDLAGRVFRLHEKAEAEWLDSQAAINVLNQAPPPCVAVSVSWQESRFGFNRVRSLNGLGLLRKQNREVVLIFPADLVMNSKDEETFQFSVDGQAWGLPDLPEQETAPPLITIPITSTEPPWAKQVVPDSRIRLASEVEDCFVVRTRGGEGQQTLLEMIGRDQIVVEGDQWKCPSVQLSRDVWHGALVLGASDEKLIGRVLVDAGLVRIIPLATAP